MSDDTSTAFAPLAARAEAAGIRAADRIALTDHVRSIEIGAFQEERGTRQRLRFGIVAEVNAPRDAGDDVDRILSYDTLIAAIDLALADERLNLLETLAARVATLVLAEPAARRVFVRIEKLDRGPHALGVEIERRAGRTAELESDRGPSTAATAAPRVIAVSNYAIADPQLAAWLDALERDPAPTIFVVGLPEGSRPRAAHPLAQRRIDLLAVEQNVWRLAGRDRRCLVVATRTEIAHAAAAGRLTVWAPAKLILDAVAPPPTGLDGPCLAAWLACVLGAPPPTSLP